MTDGATGPELRTSRLLLRRWRDSDLDPLAALHTDPSVMEMLGAPLTRTQSDGFAQRCERGFDERGFDVWAVEIVLDGRFIGAIGLRPVLAPMPFVPATEIGWRIGREHWGKGYATEGADAVLAFAFDALTLDEVVSFTARVNTRSQRVMDRLGMQRDAAGDFDHPNLRDGDRLRPHVLYRTTNRDLAAGAP